MGFGKYIYSLVAGYAYMNLMALALAKLSPVRKYLKDVLFESS